MMGAGFGNRCFMVSAWAVQGVREGEFEKILVDWGTEIVGKFSLNTFNMVVGR